MPPISLDDESLAIVTTLATPLPPWRRTQFLRDVASELRHHNGPIGPGLVARVAQGVQRRHLGGAAEANRRRAQARARARAEATLEPRPGSGRRATG
jgi:hypothetical protein